jgi:hypothetical protein
MFLILKNNYLIMEIKNPLDIFSNFDPSKIDQLINQVNVQMINVEEPNKRGRSLLPSVRAHKPKT